MYYQVLFHCFPRVIKSNSCLLETNNKKDDTEKEDSFVIPQVGISSMNSLIYILQFSSVDHSCPTLCDPMNCSTPGLPVHHQLPEFTQTHVHRVGDAIQPSHPLLSPSPPAPNPSQHQSLYTECKKLFLTYKLYCFSMKCFFHLPAVYHEFVFI